MDSGGRPLPKGEKGEIVLIMPSEEDSKKRNSNLSTASASPPKRFQKEEDSGVAFSQLDQLRPTNVQISSVINDPSPESTPRFTPTANMPPRPASETLTMRRSLARSVYSKPKSRFVEQPLPASAHVVEGGDNLAASLSPPFSAGSGSPYKAPTGTPKEPLKTATTPKTPTAAGEDDEEEIIHEYIPTREKCGRRLRFWLLLEWVALVSVMGLLVASLTIHRLQHFVIWGLEIWKWCLMVTVIFCGRLVTTWLITISVLIIEMNFMLKKKVLYFVYGIKKSVRICIWSGLVLLTWFLLFDRGVERSHKTSQFLNYVSRTLASVLIGAVLWLVKTLLLKLLASSFHVTTFFDRIQESILHQYLLQTLSGPPLMEMAEKIGSSSAASTQNTIQLSFRSERKGKETEERAVIDVAKLQQMKQDKVSAVTMKRLVNTITSSGLWTISNTVDDYEDGNEQNDKEISSEWEAKAAAIQIFKNVAKPGSKYIDEEDLLRFLSKEEMENVLPQFEGAVETKKIKKSALRNWVVRVYLERKSLSHSLNDSKTAVRQLNKLASGLVIIIVIVVWVLMMQFATTNVLVFISSQLLLVGFMFNNTCKTIFEALIFVFVTHPFDVGDRCVIDGVQMTVEEMNILTTVFLRFDNEKIYYPNSVLSTKPISNFYRSPNMGDSVEFSIDVWTPMDSIKSLKNRIKMCIDSKPHHWQCNHSMVIKEIENTNKMKMALYISHTMNFQDIGEKNKRRTDLIFELNKIFEDLQVKYHLLPQDVNLTYVGDHPINFVR